MRTIYVVRPRAKMSVLQKEEEAVRIRLRCRRLDQVLKCDGSPEISSSEVRGASTPKLLVKNEPKKTQEQTLMKAEATCPITLNYRLRSLSLHGGAYLAEKNERIILQTVLRLVRGFDLQRFPRCKGRWTNWCRCLRAWGVWVPLTVRRYSLPWWLPTGQMLYQYSFRFETFFFWYVGLGSAWGSRPSAPLPFPGFRTRSVLPTRSRQHRWIASLNMPPRCATSCCGLSYGSYGGRQELSFFGTWLAAPLPVQLPTAGVF